MSKPKIISVGEVLWDLFPDSARIGGAPANFTCHAARLGANALFVSAVGDDSLGHEAKDILEQHQVDVTFVRTLSDESTGKVLVELDANGKPVYEIHGPSAWDSITLDSALVERIAEVDAVYFGTLGQRGALSRATIRELVSLARAAKVPCVLDINLRSPFYDRDLIRESIQVATILKLSDEELAEVCVACDVELNEQQDITLGRLRKAWELDLVVMTKGADGALLNSASGTVSQPGFPTEIVDTVGAGDSFTASFLISELAGKPRQESLREACRFAAATCSHTGAIPSLRSDSSHHTTRRQS